MNLKPVELQFALHKNDEAGLKQNQSNQKPVEDQIRLADTAMKQAERQRQTPTSTDPSSKMSIREKNKESFSRQNKKRKQNASPLESTKTGMADRRDHPYKGKHIDLTT